MGRARAQMFKRVFQLTQQQPIDECLTLLGDCLVADFDSRSVQPIISICRTTVTDLSARLTSFHILSTHTTLPSTCKRLCFYTNVLVPAAYQESGRASPQRHRQWASRRA